MHAVAERLHGLLGLLDNLPEHRRPARMSASNWSHSSSTRASRASTPVGFGDRLGLRLRLRRPMTLRRPPKNIQTAMNSSPNGAPSITTVVRTEAPTRRPTPLRGLRRRLPSSLQRRSRRSSRRVSAAARRSASAARARCILCTSASNRSFTLVLASGRGICRPAAGAPPFFEPALSVSVPVMGVRDVGVGVGQGGVAVRVHVRRGGVDALGVGVLVMRVVEVAVAVLERLVGVLVSMPFPDEQRHAEDHHHARGGLRRCETLAPSTGTARSAPANGAVAKKAASRAAPSSRRRERVEQHAGPVRQRREAPAWRPGPATVGARLRGSGRAPPGPCQRRASWQSPPARDASLRAPG